jgi:type I restriction enzyme S subunit
LVKEIGVLKGDIERYSLAVGDLLVVEGNGSKEIVGMPAIWSGEIDGALHQTTF